MFNFDAAPDHRFDGSLRWEQPEGRGDILGLGTADMDFACAPCIREATRAVSEQNTFNYKRRPDIYYENMLSWFRRNYGLNLQRKWITDLPGTLAGIRLLVQCFTHPGDAVIMQTPAFAPLRQSVEACGCRFLANPMVLRDDRFELDLEGFAQLINAYHPSLFLLVNPHNPTGRLFSRSELETMVRICAENNVLVVSDEAHFPIAYDGAKYTPVLSAGPSVPRNCIQVFTLSKGFNLMGLIHAVFVIPDEDLNRRWQTFLAPFDFDYASNAFSIAAETAVFSGAADDWLREVTSYLQGNRDLFLAEATRRSLPLNVTKPEASYLFWIDARQTGIFPEHLADEILAKAAIRLNNGLNYGEAGRGFIRLNFAVTRANLLLALDRLERMFGER